MTDVLARLSSSLADRYLIERELGQGGMATVYLAHDVRHERKVALKVLRPELAAILGGERFLKEIRLTANLQHPHILPLHDSGEAEGIVYYVMPYVEGESLRDRLTREKQLPVDDAVRIATEVADALEYAHQQGVIHRDIKPENILLHGGHALVADFGIALAVSTAGAGTRMTETGMSLGTPHYMSPEQAMGEKEITPKSDVYSLGCVVYEMLVGEPPFTGPTAQAIVARVMTEQPRSLTLQRHTIPPHVEAAVRKALEKLPADRFMTAAEFAEALRRPGYVQLPATATTGAIPATASYPAETGRVAASWSRRATAVAPWVLAALAAGAAAWGWLRSPPEPPPSPVMRFELPLPESARLGDATGPNLALSPDGSRLVYVVAGAPRLFMRGLDQLEPVPIPGTEGAYNPFFSWDGSWIGFFAGGKLKKVRTGGGPALAVCDAPNGYGGSWGPRDTIVFRADSGLAIVPAAGGRPRIIARPDTGRGDSYIWPELLPSGRSVLFTVRSGGVDSLAALDLATGSIRRLGPLGSNPRWVVAGYVLLGDVGSQTVSAVPFDAERVAVTGSAIPVAERVVVGSGGAIKMGVSRGGAMVYMSGQGGRSQVVMVDRGGTVRVLTAEPKSYYAPRLSPDGGRIAITVFSNQKSDVWVIDLAQHTESRVTFDESAQRAIWTADGRRLVYARTGNSADLAWIPADGSAPAETLLTAADDQWPGQVTPDGKSLVYRHSSARRSLRYLTLDGGREVHPFLESAFQNHSPTVSPDGRWIAYVSDESGRSEVYVRPFPGPGGRWQVSLDGGTEPRWSTTGREIFFRNGNRIMAASVETRSGFSVGSRTQLFVGTFADDNVFPSYDVTRDGQRFVMVQSEATSSNVIVVLNWFDQLRTERPGPGRPTDQRP